MSSSGLENDLHHLKTWPEYFELVIDGVKNFEIRTSDRNYKVGDILILQEWCPMTNTYSGRYFRTPPLTHVFKNTIPHLVGTVILFWQSTGVCDVAQR